MNEVHAQIAEGKTRPIAGNNAEVLDSLLV